MFGTFFSSPAGNHSNVAFQHPFAFQQLNDTQKQPEFPAGTLVLMNNKSLSKTWTVLAWQVCTHYIMCAKAPETEPSVLSYRSGPQIWYLLQDYENPLNITWEKQGHLKESKLNNLDSIMPSKVSEQEPNPYLTSLSE